MSENDKVFELFNKNGKNCYTVRTMYTVSALFTVF